MKFIGIAILVFLKNLCTDSRMLPINYLRPNLYKPSSADNVPMLVKSAENLHEKNVIGLRTLYDELDSEEYADYEIKHGIQRTNKPCAVVVMSNIQDPNMQSLLRKYRYDAKGVLIPSSVRYFIKMTQGLQSSPILVPLNDKAFSPSGGFVRYYKEVPPIPHSW